MPQKTLGKWSLWLIIAMPVLFFIGTSLTNTMYASVASGRTLLDDLANRPGLAVSMLLGMACGIAAFITGLIAIIKQKDRSILVYAATIVGAALTIFLAGEVISPH